MSEYKALYRKWRPMRFCETVGQQQVSETLRTAVYEGHISHAYIFCGTRGTGKTTTAKIFSRAVNCENPIDGEPCNECPTCTGILNGSIFDVYEMDAASNRGIDDIRKIRDEVLYTPSGCRYKVYIIDEVHMLSKEAFNALLKTLEEPPEYAIFILATTEPHKVLQTIMSRCQRFDFKRINVEDIKNRLGYIAEAEEIKATDDALELLAELGDGSMRDAISLLDRCSVFANGELTAENVAETVGIVDNRELFDIADSISKKDTKTALKLCDKVLNTGKEPETFLENMTEHFRALLVSKSAGNPAEFLEKTEQAAENYKKQAEKFSLEQILYIMRTLGEYTVQSKRMSNPRISAEMCVVKVCELSYGDNVDALLARIEKLETDIANLKGGVSYSVATPQKDEEQTLPPWDISNDDKKPEKSDEIKPIDKDESKVPENMEKDGWDNWAEALSEIKKESKRLYAFLYNADANEDDGTVFIEVGGKVAYNTIAKPEGIEYLSKLFSRISEKPIKVQIFVKGESKPLKEEKKSGFSIKDLADKKDTMGDVIEIE